MNPLPRAPACRTLYASMRTALRLLVLAAAVALLGACATSAEESWIHPDTGAVPVRSAPDGG